MRLGLLGVGYLVAIGNASGSKEANAGWSNTGCQCSTALFFSDDFTDVG